MEEPLDLTVATRKRLIHDVTPCGTADRFMRALDLIPGSPEVEEMEHRASHHRLNQTAPISMAIATIASLAGEVIGRCILENQGLEPDPEMVTSYQKVAITASQAVIANLLDMNLLHIGGEL